MKIDRSRVRKSTSDVPIECQQLIERLQACSRTELLEELSKINTWTFGKCELLHWALVLDVFDKILGEAGRKSLENKWALYCDTHYTSTEKRLLLWILHFTTLLIEHSFSRHLYNSLEHLLVLLESNDMSVVLGVLNLLYMFSKRSNFISRLSPEKKTCLLYRLHHLAENWGGKENGFGLADCCKMDQAIPQSATTLHVEFHRELDESKDGGGSSGNSNNSSSSSSMMMSGGNGGKTAGKNAQNIIHIENVDKIHKTPAEIMKSLLGMYYVPLDKQMWLFTHVRLAHHFANYNNRLLCVQARLQALSVLVYSNAIQDSPHNLLYNGLLEELVELVEMKEAHLVEIRSAALRTLTAIIHLDRNPHIPKKPGSRLNNIIDVTGASQYHGFLPLLVRNCIMTLTNQKEDNQNSKKDDGTATTTTTTNKPNDKLLDIDVTMSPQQPLDLNAKFPLSLATALFSFLYHLASYEAGGEALVSCGMMESLLQVINWHGVELEHITFVTRAVRVIDLITNIDMQAFQIHGGLQSFINRLNVEVKLCKEEQLYEVKSNSNVDQTFIEDSSLPGPSSDSGDSLSTSTVNSDSRIVEFDYHPENVGKTCLPQRAALLKSMLNFLKKALQDSTFSDNIRHLMEGTLPNSLKNIIANAEYYGPSLFLLATDVVTVYVYQEPSLLSALQDNGLTEVVLHSLLVKEIPATREVLGSLPNIFSALCLNNRGLQSFIKCKPFGKTFSVLISPECLPAMRRRRSSEPMADTACNLGNAVDELMRHQPSLKGDAIKAIISLLEQLVTLGTDPKYICWKPHSKSEVSPASSSRSAANTEGSSDEEDEDEEEASTSSQNAQNDAQVQQENSERTPIALIDYILNTMKFIDAILSNNSTDDHCREFVQQGGLKPLLKILGLPNLPVNCPVTNPAQAVATVCKSILNLAHETTLFKEGLAQLSDVLEILKPMYTKLDVPSGPKLLLELAGASNVENAFNNASVTPLLHAMGAAHGYIIMLVHVCRTGQSEIRNLSLQSWGSEEGLRVIKGLADLYTSLVWESTLLLAYCSEEYIPSDFTREDIEKLNAFFDKCESSNAAGSDSTVNVASAMEALTTNPPTISMDVDQETVTLNLSTSLKYIKPLLGASSRLGRALAELFGLLVKLCVGSPIRQRRGQNIIAAPPLPTPYAQSVATALNVLLADGLDYERLPACPLLKSRITFLICSVGFTSPMLFDEKRYPYHLMLKKFVALGGQETFFNTFRWALSAGSTVQIDKAFDQGALPEGTTGFLDAWLMLLEKMVNPKAILESPHIISNRTTQSSTYRGYNFDPLKYLIQIHKLAFEAVMLLWDKPSIATYGTRLAENILTILRHILRGEKIIKEKLKAEENMTTDLSRPKATTSAAGGGGGAGFATAATTTSSTTTTGTSAAAAASTGSANASSGINEPEVNPESLSLLMNMGFDRGHVTDALLNTLTIEQATDYLLNNPPSLYRISQSFMNSESFEDDQVMQAIAISLGTSSSSSTSSSGNSSSETMLANNKKKSNQDDGKPLDENLIDEFTKSALPACLRLLDVSPESVHKVCELLVTIMKRNGRTFRDSILQTLVKEIYDNAQKVWQHYNVVFDNIQRCEYESPINNHEIDTIEAHRLANYMHLYILFFEVSSYFEMKIPCAMIVHQADLVHLLIQLVGVAEKLISRLDNYIEPKWLASTFLLIDAISKVATCTARKKEMHLSTTRVWRWFHLETGRWTPYSNSNNKLINDAYWNGEQSVRVTCGRRRYTVTFSNMLQLNDESGNNRPISMTLINLGLSTCQDTTNTNFQEPLEAELTDKEDRRCKDIPNLTVNQEVKIVRMCVKFMHMPIEKDLLHSILQICIRLTRDYAFAKIFVQEGGVKCMLRMKQVKEFSGFGVLATILIRHALEEPNTLSYAIEKIIRSRTLPTIPPYYKELLYLTRQIGGAVTRSPETFFQVAKNILRINTDINCDDPDGISVKTDPPARARAPPLEESVSNEVICDLLNALLKPLELPEQNEPNSISPTKSSSQSSDGVPSSQTSNPNNPTVGTSSNTPLTFDSIDEGGLPGAPAAGTQSTTPTAANTSLTSTVSVSGSINDPNFESRSEIEQKKKKMMLPKSVILKILGDAVVSYGPVARIITEYTYKAGSAECVKEDCTALAFILDKILPETENLSDSDCSTMCRMLIAAIASSNHSFEAQFTLVSEVRSALLRALMLPESTEKHSQVQLIAGIISIMIDHCPSSSSSTSAAAAAANSTQSSSSSSRVNKPAQSMTPQMNNIVRLMVRKSLFNDLARVPHYLDLSSPNTPFTVNACLKSLEALSRIVNQPVPVSYQKNKKNQQIHNDENLTNQSTSGGPSNESGGSGGANQQQDDNVVIDDSENTEHDIAVVTSTIEVEANENENVLVHMIDQLLEQGNDNNQSFGDVPSSRNHTMDIDDDNLTFEHERDATEELMSTDSGESDSNPSDQVEDEENDDNEGDDDNIDDADDTNYDDDDGAGSSSDRRRSSNYMDRNDDVLMIQYTNPGTDNEVVTRMVAAYPMDQTFSIPLFDEINNSNDHTGPIVHPLLLSRSTNENNTNTVTRTQRVTRARRYQYLFNPRNPNPPVILQRLLGPHEPQVTLASANGILGGPPEMGRESTRLVVMDNFGILPSHEEHIDFVDQSGYLFGPSLAATLNHISPVLHWWNIESKCLDFESVHDVTTSVCNKLIPFLVINRNVELTNKKKNENSDTTNNSNRLRRYTYTTDGSGMNENFNKPEDSNEPSANEGTDEDIDGVPIDPIENLAEERVNLTMPINFNEGQMNYIHGFITPPTSHSPAPQQQQQQVPLQTSTIDSQQQQQQPNNDASTSNSVNPFELPPLRGLFTLPEQSINMSPDVQLTDIFDSGNTSRTSVNINNDENTIRENDDTLFFVNENENRPMISDDVDDDNVFEETNREEGGQRSGDTTSAMVGDETQEQHEQQQQQSASALQQPIVENDLSTTTGSTLTVDGNSQQTRSSLTNENFARNHLLLNAVTSSPLPGPSGGVPPTSSASITTNATATESSSDQNEEEIPDGVDPSFLEALPPDMRQEVLEQHRFLRLQQRIAARNDTTTTTTTAAESTSGVSTEVSPEFLAALPPSLQEEVLSQQRLEQQRQAAAQANPNEPVDAGAFFETLQPSLRTMILSDMEESQMSALPPDLAAEAQTLRRDWEARNRQMVQERLLQSNLSIIRQSRRQPLHHSPGHFPRAQWTHWNREFMHSTIASNPNPLKIRGRQLLDHEGLSCLLVLLFTDDPHLGKLRLHRVIRNLCYHAPTREWIVNALLSIIDKSVHIKVDDNNVNNKQQQQQQRKLTSNKPGSMSNKLLTDSKVLQNNGNWLNIRMEAALGCSANVFIVNRASSGKKSDRSALGGGSSSSPSPSLGANTISIHPQAAPIVCRNTLDLFTSLAKAFPSCLLPIKCIRDDRDDKNNLSPVRVKFDGMCDFWDILLKLDSVSTKKGKSIPKSANNNTTSEIDTKSITFEQSVFGQLLNMLSSPIVNRNTQLTDNLLRLLSVITGGIPELTKPPAGPVKKKNQLTKLENSTPNPALNLAINVITYKSCSEEGLEYITELLLNLAGSTLEMSYMILNLLLDGAMRIGEIVKDQIKEMLKELKDMNSAQIRKLPNDEMPSTSKGTIANRFTKETVIITASTKAKASCELQLPSMIPLTSKSSSQLFFLKVLRVIVPIRNTFKQNVKRYDSNPTDLPALSDQLNSIDSLWETLSQCLSELEHTPDHHAVLVLQPVVEAFFLVHSPQQGPTKKPLDGEQNNQTGQSTTNNDGQSATTSSAPPPPTTTSPSASLTPTTTTATAASSSSIIAPVNPSVVVVSTAGDASTSTINEINQQSDSKFINSDVELNATDNTSKAVVPPEQQKFLSFAEKHRRVLNQILRQSTTHLADGPFAVLVDHTRILDFDIKRRYFRSELERMDQGIRREETAVHVRRSHIFEDSFRELYRRSPEEWKNRFYIVFEDEEGQDAGGLLREWYVIISRDIFNPMYALFTVSPGDRVTYMINSASHYNPNHLCYYKFVGRVIAKAIYDNKLLECYFTRSFYKHILGIPVKYTDMESEDYSFYRGLVYLMENNINNLGLDLTFSTEINEFGVTETRDLIPNGRHVPVTEETKMEYIRLSCQMKMTGAIKQQLNAFLEGFYDIIPMRLISIFNEQELELLISGLPNVDIDDLKANTEYHKYQANSLQIQWFWRALRSFDQADRAKFLQFVTGTSKVPLQGFGALEGMNGVQKFQIHRDDRSTDRLPSAHTCFNQLDLPVYETYDKLRSYLLKAIHECSEGFGFA